MPPPPLDFQNPNSSSTFSFDFTAKVLHSKPRLVKTRRRHVANKPKPAPSPGDDPSSILNRAYGPVFGSNGCSLNPNFDGRCSNVNLECREDVSLGYNRSYGSVFGVNSFGLNPNSNAEGKRGNDCFPNSDLGRKDSVKYDRAHGSVVGMTNCKTVREQSNGCLSNSDLGCKESINLCFNPSEPSSVFKSDSSLRSGLNVEKNESCTSCSDSNPVSEECNGNGGVSGEGDFGKSACEGFVFGTGKSCFMRNSVLKNKKSGGRRDRNFTWVSNTGQEQPSKNTEKLDCDTREDAKKSSTDFVFGDKWSESFSNLNKENIESKKNGEKSVPVDNQKVKPDPNEEFRSMPFAFGATSMGTSHSNFEKMFEDGGKMKAHTEFGLQRYKASDSFLFGSSSKKSSDSKEFDKIVDESSYPNSENCMNNSDSVNNNIYRSDSFSINKQHFVFGSTVNKLSDEMGKMTVEETKNMANSGDIKGPVANCSVTSDHMFVFRCRENCSGSYILRTDEMKDQNCQGPKNFTTVEKTEDIDVRTTTENKNASSGVGVSDEPIQCPFETCEADVDETRSDVPSTGISTPNPSTFEAGLCKSPSSHQYQANLDSNQCRFWSNALDFEAFTLGRTEDKDKTPISNASYRFSANPSACRKSSYYSERRRSIRGRKNDRKSKKVDPIQQQPSKNNQESCQNRESPGYYSPMDFSPYRDDYGTPFSNITTHGLAKDAPVTAATEGADDTSKEEEYCIQQNREFSKNFWEQFAAEYSFEEVETAGRNSNSEQISKNNGNGHDEVENNSRNQSCIPSSSEANLTNLTFSATSKEGDVSTIDYRNRKKYRMKVGRGPNNVVPRHKVDTAGSSSYLNLRQEQTGGQNTFDSQRMVENNIGGDGGGNQESTATIMKACEKWRIRGNQAYENGYLSKAEKFYTKGINSFPLKEVPGCSIEPLVLCYSNRAAARMSAGRIREALGDCVIADSLDPSFQKVQLRAANCHLALGEIEKSCQYFTKCLESRGDVCLDRRIAIEAASGLQKAQKLTHCMDQCAELLRNKTSTAANSVLEILSAPLLTSPHSEKLLELKGEALLMLRRYKEVTQLCKQTLVFAEKNFLSGACNKNEVNVDSPNSKNSTILLWRWHQMTMSYFYLGRLELALELLEKREALASCDDGGNSEDLSILSAATVHKLLLHKNAGNEAFQSGRHTEAVEHYSAAVSSGIGSLPFAAICFCNRAAANQALGQLSDAISDCSIAIALDGSYSKAVSRRATLYEKIRDYASATSDLQKLISLLEEPSQENNCGSASAERPSGSNVEQLKQARRRLASVEDKAKKELSLDHYLILGVKSSDEASEIKKAYRKAALKHHPDKAGQFLARGDNGDDGRLWKDICEEVQKDADRLFKTIGEAYAILSDPIKRSEYDHQEELRAYKERNRQKASTRSPDFCGTPFRSRGNNGRHWQEYWTPYGNSRSQY